MALLQFEHTVAADVAHHFGDRANGQAVLREEISRIAARALGDEIMSSGQVAFAHILEPDGSQRFRFATDVTKPQTHTVSRLKPPSDARETLDQLRAVYSDLSGAASRAVPTTQAITGRRADHIWGDEAESVLPAPQANGSGIASTASATAMAEVDFAEIEVRVLSALSDWFTDLQGKLIEGATAHGLVRTIQSELAARIAAASS